MYSVFLNTDIVFLRDHSLISKPRNKPKFNDIFRTKKRILTSVTFSDLDGLPVSIGDERPFSLSK